MVDRPVGLCALINAENYKPKNILAVDSVQLRLDLAKSLGAEPWNFQTDREGLDKRVKELTDGRGADAVIGVSPVPSQKGIAERLPYAEVVGSSPALKMGFELLRPWGTLGPSYLAFRLELIDLGVISSVGVHNAEVCFLYVS